MVLSENLLQIAKKLLCEYELILNYSSWEIKEIEFYLNSETHPDPFVHKHHDYETGQLRIHGAGIDIAIKINGRYGGILLRSIQKSDENLIEGPIKVCETIIKNMGTIENATLSFLKLEKPLNEKVYYAPRVGLKPEKIETFGNRFEFLVKNYRFFKWNKLDAEKYLIALSMKYNFSEEIQGLDKSTFDSYKQSYEQGRIDETIDNRQLIEGNLIRKAYLYGFFSKNN